MNARLLQGVLIGIAATVVALVLQRLGTLQALEHVTWDWRVNSFASTEAASSPVKLILLDQGSLDWASQEMAVGWPWPRELYGALIDFCVAGGARAVLLDVLFTEGSHVDQDEALADAMRRSGRTVAASISGSGEGGAPMGDVPTVTVAGWDRWLETQPAPAARTINLPIPSIRESAAAIGTVMRTEDAEIVIRRQGVFDVVSGRAVPSLALAGLLAGENQPPLRIEPGWFQVGDTRIPLDQLGRTILRYRDPATRFAIVSADAVLQSQMRILEGGEPVLDPDWCRDAYVVFGFSAPGLLDLRPTPLSPVSPGVMVHATLLDNLLQGTALRDVPGPVAALFTLGLALVAALSMRCSGKARQAIGVWVLCVAGSVAPGWLGYAGGWWMPVSTPVVAVVLSLLGGLLVNYALEGRARIFIKNAFSHYLSPVVIEQILQDPDRLQLGGERRELTIFFSDLRGFSSISERLDATELTALLNEYLSDMSEIIKEENGTLDKYEGDAIIAFWNAPIDQPDHAERAVRAAVRCHRRMAEKQPVYRRWSGEDLGMRIGVNTGIVVVGNMGGHDRFDYTVLGDAANLASRLEGANKVFGTGIMVSQATWQQCGDSVIGREIGQVRVVGRDTPVRVYEPLGLAGEAPPEGLAVHAQAVAAFEEGRLGEAESLFAGRPDDPLAQAYLQRLRGEQRDAGGDPVWTLTSK